MQNENPVVVICIYCKAVPLAGSAPIKNQVSKKSQEEEASCQELQLQVCKVQIFPCLSLCYPNMQCHQEPQTTKMPQRSQFKMQQGNQANMVLHMMQPRLLMNPALEFHQFESQHLISSSVRFREQPHLKINLLSLQNGPLNCNWGNNSNVKKTTNTTLLKSSAED
jgi:hypothetical protein